MHNKGKKSKMIYPIINFIQDYLTYIIGSFIQILFILLPVNLKNWEDDSINSASYIGLQIFASCIVFLFSPWFFDVKIVSFWTKVWLIFGTGIVAFFRVVKLIPLEFTYPDTIKLVQPMKLEFEGFFSNERYALLKSLDFGEADANMRYNALREKLIRVKMIKSSNSDDDIDDV